MDHQINGHKLHYEITGSGGEPWVVLLHHGLGSIQSWKAQIPDLEGAGFSVLAYDRWGYGGSDPRPELLRSDFASDRADLLALLDVLRIEKTALVGHSDGGTLALYFAADHPRRVARLVVVAAHIYVEAKMETGIRSVAASYDSEPRFRAGLARLHGEKTDSVFQNWYQGWLQAKNRSWDMRAELGKITCLAWVVQGMEDEHATPRHARDLADALPRAQAWLPPGAGHMLPQDLASQFNPWLINFLTR